MCGKAAKFKREPKPSEMPRGRHAPLALALGAFVSSAAWSQQTGQPPQAAAATAIASSTTAAQTSDAVTVGQKKAADELPAQLQTVTVTARRRRENSQDVPATASSVSGNQLDMTGIYQVQDLQQLLPDVNAAYAHARQSSLSVRGIGNNPANEGLESSVGAYLDNVYLGRPGMVAFDLLDIQQIDLLRGPQGTLFGKNTTAGVLNISTVPPSFDPEAKFETSGGNRGYTQYLGSLSGPIGDHWAGRLSASRTSDDGWITNINNGDKLDGIGRDGFRGQLLYAPDQKFSLRLIADYNAEDGTEGASVITGIGPAKAGYNNLLAVAAAAGAGPVPTDWRKYQTSLDGPQSMSARQGGTSAEANLELGGGFQLTSITAWRFWDFSPHNDVDETNASIIADYGFTVRDRQFSQEIRLASPLTGAFDYVVGAFFFNQNISDTFLTETGPWADVALLPMPYASAGYNIFNNLTSTTDGRELTDSYALFSQGNWHITRELELTAGVRGTYEEKDARVYRNAPIGGTPLPASLAAVRAGQFGAWDSGTIHLYDLSPSGLLTLSYKLTPDLLGYASLSHGEKSGGVSISGVGSAPTAGADSLVVGPERANNAELGIKSTFWHQRLKANVNLFLTQVGGYQATGVVTPAGTSIPVQALTNVGKVETKGIEWDLSALPLRGLTLSLNGSYDDARYRSFDNAPCPAETNVAAPASCNLSGQPVQGSPRWTLNTSGNYRWHWNNFLSQEVAANFGWRSSSYGNIDNSVYNILPAYGLLNVSTGVQAVHGKNTAGISIWGRNVLDRHYLLSGSASIDDTYTATVGAPRTIGATFRYSYF